MKTLNLKEYRNHVDVISPPDMAMLQPVLQFLHSGFALNVHVF